VEFGSILGKEAKMARQRVLATMLALCCLHAVAAEARKLYPVDEGPKDRSFLVFRRKLMEAVRKRDRQFLYSILDPQVRTGNWGEWQGIKAFKEHWELDKPDSVVWEVLEEILSLGGAFSKRGRFLAPYVSARWPEDFDAEHRAAVIARNVRVRKRPSMTAPVIETLSYDIVRVHREEGTHDDRGETFIKITTPGGKQGYVAYKYLRNPAHSHAYFQKKRGKWWMTALEELH
jgi:hypothetical protein